MKKPHVAALERAVEMAGSQEKLALAIAAYLNRPTISQQTISYWLRRGTLLDAKWWQAITYASNGAVTATDLRPDVFPDNSPVSPGPAADGFPSTPIAHSARKEPL